MSRSYKKNPYLTDNSTSKFGKKLANKRVRMKLKNKLLQNSDYKKLTESYEICDFKFFSTRQDALNWYYAHQDDEYIKRMYPTEKEVLAQWYRCYKGK